MHFHRQALETACRLRPGLLKMAQFFLTTPFRLRRIDSELEFIFCECCPAVVATVPLGPKTR